MRSASTGLVDMSDESTPPNDRVVELKERTLVIADLRKNSYSNLKEFVPSS